MRVIYQRFDGLKDTKRLRKHGVIARGRLECEIAEHFSLVERSSDVSQGKMIDVWARVNGSKLVLIVLYRRDSI